VDDEAGTPADRVLAANCNDRKFGTSAGSSRINLHELALRPEGAARLAARLANDD